MLLTTQDCGLPSSKGLSRLVANVKNFGIFSEDLLVLVRAEGQNTPLATQRQVQKVIGLQTSSQPTDDFINPTVTHGEYPAASKSTILKLLIINFDF